MFCKKGVLRNFWKFTGKHLYQSLFFNKVSDLGQACEFWEISKNTFFHRTPPVAASINSRSLRDLSHNQLMKLVKNTRFHNQIAFTELNYHFKMSLNFTHTKKNILNEYSISISNQSIISKQRFDFKRKLRFKNSISNRVFISKSTLNFVIKVGTLTWNLNSVLISILKIKFQFRHIDFRHLDQFWNRSCSILNYFT